MNLMNNKRESVWNEDTQALKLNPLWFKPNELPLFTVSFALYTAPNIHQ